ncbi:MULTISPECIES: futalosine hydrolase [unclassified Frankia]|uniref:futalosine hydrolase n=1 Tax=unclassified Frankia TaxID=2632575 RepID=UPI001EF56A39|nr:MULTISPECIES: futalosine hydrolase [unclassified Frankia]
MNRILLVTAVSPEADAVCAGMMGMWQPRATVAGAASSRGGSVPSWDRQLLTAVRLGPYLGRRSGSVTVLAAGVAGPAAAAGTATALAIARASGDPFDLVISLGIAGGFAGRADIGDLVVADALVAADLGAEAGADGPLDKPASQPPPAGSASSANSGADGFLSLEQLGLGPSRLIPRESVVERLVTLLAVTGRTIRTGPVLSVSTVTGTERRAAALALRFGPAAEAMEGYAVGVAAAAFDTPFAEVRAVSNAVGHRDRSNWDVPEALAGLSAAAASLAAGIDTLASVLPAADGSACGAGPAKPAPGAGTR